MIYALRDPLAEFTNLDFAGLAGIGKLMIGIGILFLGLSLCDRSYRRQGLAILVLGIVLLYSRSLLNYLIS